MNEKFGIEINFQRSVVMRKEVNNKQKQEEDDKLFHP
jgi:hypothetical protein